MKKLIVLVLTLAVVCGLLFAFNVSADEGTTVNIASEAEVTTPTTSFASRHQRAWLWLLHWL